MTSPLSANGRAPLITKQLVSGVIRNDRVAIALRAYGECLWPPGAVANFKTHALALVQRPESTAADLVEMHVDVV